MDTPSLQKLLDDIKAEIAAGNKIAAIKLYRDATGAGLAEAKEAVELIAAGKPPKASHEELVTLPGVGRKTANMVRGNAFGQQAIAVDTHVLRVSNRLGLVASDDPDEVEAALVAKLPADRLTAFGNALILHGRETCTARAPRCGACVLREPCPWPDKTPR